MIRLSTNRGLVELNSWDDIVTQPGYKSSLDPNLHKLREIIGAYSLPERHPCGLSICRTPHLRGYLVVTESGALTNIGNICGKKRFGLEFQRMARLYRQMARDQENRDTINTAKSRLPELKKQLKTLRDGRYGGRWIYHSLKALRIPDAVRQKLWNMAKVGDGRIIIEREARQDERDTFEAMQGRRPPRPYYVEEEVGFIRGIEILRPENCPRKRLIYDLESLILELEKANPGEMPPQELKQLARACGELNSRFSAARRIVETGQQFFDVENLAKLDKIMESPAERKEFREYLKVLASEIRDDQKV